jgi:hypothetical protein
MSEELVIDEKLPDGSYKTWRLSPVWVAFPSGQTGYRLEYVDEEAEFHEDLGTITIMGGKLVVVQW